MLRTSAPLTGALGAGNRMCGNVKRAVVVASLLVAGCSRAPSIGEGTFYGYEYMPNLSPDQPEAYWYHENEMTIQGSVVRIEKYPRTLIGEKVWASASDGGFYTLEGSIEQLAGRTLVKLRLLKCDYCMTRADDPLPSKKVREYVVMYEEDGSFELDRVRYRREPNPKLHWKPDA